MAQDRDLSADIPDARKRTGMKAINAGAAPDYDPSERIADIYKYVVDMSQRVIGLEKKVDALIRREFLDRSRLSVLQGIRADRFPMLSQHEEAGYLLALFTHIGEGTRRFVDIGCGVNGGNCGFFALEAGWSGLLVDEAPQCIREVEVLYRGTAAKTLQWSVTPDNVNRLFSEHGFGADVDLFSLDVDGPDYWVWQGLTAVQPRVVVLEYNSTFGPTAAVTIPYDREFDNRTLKGVDRLYFGASLTALTRLSARKGYRLIATDDSGANAIYLRHDVAAHIPAATPEQAFRWLPKHRNQVLKIGDALTYFNDRGLPLTTVD